VCRRPTAQNERAVTAVAGRRVSGALAGIGGREGLINVGEG
jgi:hypothetical protein